MRGSAEYEAACVPYSVPGRVEIGVRPFDVQGNEALGTTVEVVFAGGKEQS